MLPLAVKVNVVCLLAQYLINQGTEFNETKKVIIGCTPTTDYLKSQSIPRWPSHLLDISQIK